MSKYSHICHIFPSNLAKRSQFFQKYPNPSMIVSYTVRSCSNYRLIVLKNLSHPIFSASSFVLFSWLYFKVIMCFFMHYMVIDIPSPSLHHFKVINQKTISIAKLLLPTFFKFSQSHYPFKIMAENPDLTKLYRNISRKP